MDTAITKIVDELEEGEIDEKEDDGVVILEEGESNESTEVTILEIRGKVDSKQMKAEDKKASGRRTLLPDPVLVRINDKNEGTGANSSNKKGGVDSEGLINGVETRADRSRPRLQRKRRPQKMARLRSSSVKTPVRSVDVSRTVQYARTVAIPVRTVSASRFGYSHWKRTGGTFASRQTSKQTPARSVVLRRREPSYDDLLAQYREIQSQLDDLTSKERKGCIDESGVGIDDLGKENIAKTDKDYIELRCDAQAERSGRRERLPCARRRLSLWSSLSSTDSKEQRKEDEDEELELRRVALNSTLRRRLKQEDKLNGGSSDSSERTLAKNLVSGDNYEVVSPDCNDFPQSASEEGSHAIQKGVSEVDEDVDILRAMLLSSLTNKQLEKSTKLDLGENVEQKISPVANLPVLRSVTVHRTVPQLKPLPVVVPPTPVHDPVVIRLNEDDSDSETDAEFDSSKPSSLLNSIDSFLCEARQKSEQFKQSEQVSQQTQSVICVNTDGSTQQQSFGGQPSKVVAAVETGNIVLKSDVSQAAELKRREKDLLKHRESMFENQRELQKVKLQMSNKMSVSKVTETKITKLREQLAGIVKIADKLKSDMSKLQGIHDSLAKDMEFKKSQKVELEKDCLAFGKQLCGELYKLPQSPKVLGIKRKFISNISPIGWKRRVSEGQRRVIVTNLTSHSLALPSSNRLKLSSEEMAKEKARLKKMELEVASKLQELRRNANAAGQKLGTVTTLSSERDSRKDKSSMKRERRISFIDRNPSTKPELTRSEEGFKHPGVSQDSANASTDKESSIMLTDRQLERFKKLQSLSEFVDSFSLDKLESVPLNSYDIHDIFHKHKLSGLRFLENIIASEALGTANIAAGPLQQYKSPLLHFRTYRFSPYFRNKANHCLTWPTYSQKVSPSKTMCRFELPGTCNDDKCTWQHTRDYVMTPKEVLCDIVSYCPMLTGLKDATATSSDCKLAIESYVDNLLSSNKDRMTHDQLCILTVGRVNETMGKAPPHYITFDDRQWHPTQEPSNAEAIDYECFTKRKTAIGDFRHRECDSGELDELLEEGESRYFSTNEEGVDVLECAVIENPKNVDLWLRLACKKLHQRHSSPDVSLDMALNVLSRGLEQSQQSKELWLHYLSMYSKRKDCKDLAELCEQAVKFSPCYEVWWKCLQYAEGYVSKKEISGKMLDYVLKSAVAADVMSRQVVEVVLYNVQLCILTGRCHEGQSILEGALGEGKSYVNVMDHLVSFDRCILWLCYIHVLEFHCLPSSLFNPGNSGLGPVVSKLPFLLPWRKGHTFGTSLRDLVMIALRKCVQKGQSAKANAQVCLPLYRNLMALEMCRNKYHLAVGICQQLLKVAATDEVYVLLARMQSDSGHTDVARETLNTALKSDSASPYIFHFAAAFELSDGRKDDACTRIGLCASSMFEFSSREEEDACSHEPEAFYRHLLGLPIPLGTNDFKLKVLWSYVAEQKLYIWLNYCIWLASNNRHEDVRDVYESAIVQMTSASDLQIVWLHYLRYVLQASAVSTFKQHDMQHIFSLVRRCISSVPSVQSRTAGCESRRWTDYNFFNKVVDLYVDAVADCDQVKVYEAFCSLAPTNACLVLRLLRIYMESERYADAQYLAKNRLETLSSCWDLWKVAIYLAKRDEKFSQVKWLYSEASKSLPYNIQVWKEFISFELSRGQLENAKSLIDRCRQLGIAIDGLLESVLEKD